MLLALHRAARTVGFLLAASATVFVNASLTLTLTLCPQANNTSLPCLNDTNQANTTYLARYDATYYNFSNLNISYIQDLPPSARTIDLSYNNIAQISCKIPASLTVLNLSHNALQTNWIQTPLTISSLDLNDNPNVMLSVDSFAYGRLYYGGVSLDLQTSSYNATLATCAGNANFVQSFYSAQTSVGPPKCVYLCYWGYSINTPASYEDPGKQAFHFILVGVGSCAILFVLASLAMRFAVKWQERYVVYLRGTISGSNCSDYDDLPSERGLYVQHPATPRND
ncbi:hypothetical protein Ae201684P_007618 [Aphanomyces euteiches]|nr:hypothetical protein Ae201684P_007618 [Aphanomyces euteiches]